MVHYHKVKSSSHHSASIKHISPGGFRNNCWVGKEPTFHYCLCCYCLSDIHMFLTCPPTHTHPHSNTQTQRHAASSKTPISNNLISDAPPECDKSVSVHGADNSIHWKPAACLHYMITSPDQVLSVTDLWKLSCLSCKCASMNENRMDLNGWNLWHVLV